ncbi:MAG: hypothetical protein SGPRY_004977 [Prymnesium sp.]
MAADVRCLQPSHPPYAASDEMPLDLAAISSYLHRPSTPPSSPDPRASSPLAPSRCRTPLLSKRQSSDACWAYLPCQEHLLQPTLSNPLPTSIPPPSPALAGITLGERNVFCFIGLPGRGKAFHARRTCHYLSFFHGAKVKLFELSRYRDKTGAPPGSQRNAIALLADVREFISGESEGESRSISLPTEVEGGQSLPLGSPSHDDGVCRPRRESIEISSTEGGKRRADAGRVAIVYSNDSFDSLKEVWSGTSKEGRRWADKSIPVALMFIEIIVSDPAIIASNIRAKAISEGCPAPTSEQIEGEMERMDEYARRYVTLQDDGSEDDLAYVKVGNYGRKVVANNMHGNVKMRVAQFLTTLHTAPHVIYLTRHGQSEYNVLGKIGGNPPLSEAGNLSALPAVGEDLTISLPSPPIYARRLGEWVPENVWKQDGKLVKARLWTSSLQRTILTARHIPHPVLPISSLSDNWQDSKAQRVNDGDEWEQTAPRVFRSLDEIFAGEYEGYRYAEIKAKAAKEADLRSLDKLGYRYPRGESYLDIIQRLDPLIQEMEMYREPLLIVSHQANGAVHRIIFAYLMNLPRTMAPKLDVRADEGTEGEGFRIPLHTVIKITYDGWSLPKEERFYLGPDGLCDDGQSLY